MAPGGAGERAMQCLTHACVRRERSVRGARCSSREQGGAHAKAYVWLQR